MDVNKKLELFKILLGVDTKENIKLSDEKAEAKSDTPSAEGEYELTDGRKITIKEGKVIISEAAKKADEKKADEKTADKTEQVAEPDFSKEIELFKKEIDKLKTEFQTVTKQLKEAGETQIALSKMVDLIADKPAADPLKRTVVADSTPADNTEELKAFFTDEQINMFTKPKEKPSFSINVAKFKNR